VQGIAGHVAADTAAFVMFLAYAFNNVIAPCLVSLFASSLCFNELVDPPSAIPQNFSYVLSAHSSCVAPNSTVGNRFISDDIIESADCYTFSDPASKKGW